MPTNNWKNIDVKSIANDAAKKTDAELASKISSLTKMTDADIKKILPEKGDVAAFVEMMQIIKSADNQNQKVNKIVGGSEKFAGIVVKLLGAII